jgi:uroporphyrinogen-III synthase
VAVQEYGTANAELLEGLRARGARVTRVPVYRWALPEDVEPLRTAVGAVARGDIDVVMFTTSMQVIASIGPTTSEQLQRHGLSADLEPSHPKMGLLVREAAERARDLLRAKR